MPATPRVFTVVSILAVTAGTATAQETPRSAAESISLSDGGGSYGSQRSKANDWMIMPSGTTTLGGSLQFLTAPSGFGDDKIRFTDVVMIGVRARRSFAKRYEIFGNASFLPKQPSFTDELEWQGASGGLRVGLGKRYASFLAAATGPLLGDRGEWVAGTVGAEVRKSLHETLVVEGSSGLAYTSLVEDDRDVPTKLVEAKVSGELVFRAPNGAAAGWIGTEFRFPVMDSSEMSTAGALAYDPQTRVNFHLGVVLSYIPDWDIFAKFAVIDRGDFADPTTTLPILDGGFDQQQLVIGLTYRMRPDKDDGGHAYLAE